MIQRIRSVIHAIGIVARARSFFIITDKQTYSRIHLDDHYYVRDVLKLYSESAEKANWLAEETMAGRMTIDEANEQLSIDVEKAMEEINKKHVE